MKLEPLGPESASQTVSEKQPDIDSTPPACLQLLMEDFNGWRGEGRGGGVPRPSSLCSEGVKDFFIFIIDASCESPDRIRPVNSHDPNVFIV